MHNREITKRRAELLLSKGLNPNDSSRWSWKWRNLVSGAKLRQVECKLTFEEYIQLAVEAGINDPEQIGCSSNSFCMGRVGDVGIYEFGNCRFITNEQNLKERAINGGDQARSLKMIGRKLPEETKRKIAESIKNRALKAFT